jgi:hypothetical protein
LWWLPSGQSDMVEEEEGIITGQKKNKEQGR